MENLFAQSGKSFCSKWKIFLPVAETAACGGAGKVGEGVINLSTNFLNATSLIRKRAKMLSPDGFYPRQHCNPRPVRKIGSSANNSDLWEAARH